MARRELSAADIYHKFAAQLDKDGFRLYHAAQRSTGFQPYDAFPYEDNRGAFEAADGHTLLRYLEAAHFDAVTWEIVPGTTYERARTAHGIKRCEVPDKYTWTVCLWAAMLEVINDCPANIFE